MTSFNYFFTPVGPEYKKKFARNIGIGLLILFAFYGIWNMSMEFTSKPERDSLSNQKCAELYDKIFDTWIEHVKENFGGPGQPQIEPPSVADLVSGWKGGEEFRNTYCRYRVNDWAHLVNHQEQVWGYVDWPKLEPFIHQEPSTSTKISFGKIEGRTILPVTITEITTNPDSPDEITKWGFSQLNITMANLGKTWGNLAPQYTGTDFIDENGNDILDKSRLEDGMIFYPADQHLYPATCNDGVKIIGESHHPMPIPITKQPKTIFIKSTSNGIYPDENGIYRIDYFSIFHTEIEFPESAEIILHESTTCKLDKKIEEDPQGKYTHGYYTKAIFRLES